MQRAPRERDAAAGRPGINDGGLVADIVQPPPELETAVEAVLGERLGNVIVESHEAGVEAIEFLKRTREGRSSFIPRGACAAHAARGEVVYDARAAAASTSAASMAAAFPPIADDAIAAAGRRATACAGRCWS